MDDKRKDHADPNWPHKGTPVDNYRPVRTDDVENTNSTN